MKRSKIIFFALISLLTVSWVISVNAEDICRYKADPALSNMKTWSDLRNWFERYLICDDGYFGEGLSEFVTITLSKRWNSISDLQAEISKNPKLRKFVLSHIDATADEFNLMAIEQNAEGSCPPSIVSLCQEIKGSAQMAIKEISEIE